MSFSRQPHTRPVRPDRDGRGDRGTGLLAAAVPALAALGLLVVAVVSVSLLTGRLPIGGGGGDSGPFRTPTPSNVVVVDPRARVLGTIAYVKDGNIWVQNGDRAKQLTQGGLDSMPSFSPDGAFIYFVRVTQTQGKFRTEGEVRIYDLSTPSIMRIPADGSGQAQALFTGTFKTGSYTWQTFLRQPRLSPDGSTLAVMTDGPDPTKSDVLLKFIDVATGKLTDPKIPENAPLGHQDPVWSPDGTGVYFVKNARDFGRGTPAILRYDVATKKTAAVTGPGYMQPSVSPNGRFLAVTRTSAIGTDVAILDATTGAEVLRITNDGRSFAPVWSPAGDELVFERVEGGVVDLFLVRLAGTPGTWVVEETLAMTVSAGLDAASGAAWFIPASQLPTPAPTTPPAASVGPS